MAKKEKILLPKPKSAFYLVECPNCKIQKIVFSHSTINVKCPSCSSILCESTGGKAIIKGNIVRRLDQV
ncbi:MAG: 30S ribosomal protein S27e [Nitrososphaeria archaeon]|nr:30S ribosomal protein S27e [Nitrososphaeria archaeon]